MGYTRSAIEGFGWNTGLKLAGNLITLLKISVLARLLTPTDFGLFSLVAIALGLTEALTETGINITLLQSKKPVEYFLDTAWVIAILRGILIACVMLIMGIGMSRFFNQPELLLLVAVAAFVPLVKGFINPAIITLYKSLSFFADTGYRFSLILIDAALAIGAVFLFRTVASWIAAMVLTGLLEVVISFLFFKLKPKFAYVRSRASAIFANAKWLSLSSGFSYLNENTDNLIVGKLTGTFNLGLYQNAYALAHKPNYDLAKSVHHSTLPIYSRLSDDVPRLRSAFFKSLSFSTFLTVGASVPLLIAPDFFVKLILGDQWITAVPLVRWLVIAGLVHALTLVGYSLLIARSHLRVMNLHQAVSFGLLLLLMWWGVTTWGLEGATKAVAFARIATFPILFLGVRKALKLPVTKSV